MDPKPPPNHKPFRFETLSNRGAVRQSADLIVETPIEITVNGEGRVFIMFTPVMVRELVVGFLFTEGVIQSPEDMESCEICCEPGREGDDLVTARVRLAKAAAGPPAPHERRISYSSCGICGKADYENLKSGIARVKSRHRFFLGVLETFSASMKGYQPLYQRTEGAHAAILVDKKGKAIVRCEDLGRHNALDKLVGCVLLQGIPREDKVVFSSGRASLEMILKTARAGFPVFVAMSRPTSRAVEAAKYYNITLLDMAKGSHRIYTHARRIEPS